MLQNEPNFMLVRYSIVKLLMVFEVSAQREHTIVLGDNISIYRLI